MGSGASSQQESEATGLVDVLRNSSDDKARIDAYSKIYNASNDDRNKILLAMPSLGLLPEIKRTMKEKSGLELEWAAACLCQLGINDNNKVMLSSRDLGLMPVVMANISKLDNCFTIMTNIMLRPENHDYLLSKEVGLMQFVKNFLDDFDAKNFAKDEKYLKIYSNISACLKKENLDLFMSYYPIEAMVKRMLASTTQSLGNNNGCGYWILNFLNRISYHPAAAARLKELNAVPVLTEMMRASGIAGLKATIAVSNMIGKDEASNHSQSMVQSQPEMFALLLKLFKATLMKDQGPEAEECKKLHGYLFGMIKMRNICGAIRTLTISDTNKPLMLKTNVVDLLVRTLRLFTENALQLNILVNNMDQTAGGGGDDDETASVAIEALLQLSFNYEMDERLREVFTSASDYDIIDILSACVADSRGKLSSEAKRNAASLLKRLKLESGTATAAAPVTAAASATTPSASSRPTKHIMLSYSWAVNKPLVVKVGQRLRELGHEVWRDEEGSALVGPMQGDTDERMAAAIEAAHTVVIFVSPQYKESGNCRMEAKYSKQRQLVCPLKILYVMMCENYHTRSNPPVDGWLALNIGTDLWYPLWSESMLNSTVQAISDLVGDGSFANTVPSVAPSAAPAAAAVASQSSSGGSLDLDTAWQLLTDPASSNEPDQLTNRINAIGIGEVNDLTLLEEEELLQLADLMKPLKKRKFLAALNKAGK